MFGGIIFEVGKCYLILEDGVIVGVGVKVLGFFIVGKNVCIGFNFVVFNVVLVGVIVIGILGCVVKVDFEFDDLFDVYGMLI